MALSGRLANSVIPSFANGASVIFINEAGKRGMLKIFGIDVGANDINIKIELDGVTLYNGLASKFFVSGSSGGGHGMTITTGTSVETKRKLLNLPFNDSLKITLTNNVQGGIVNITAVADYVIDIV